MEAYKAWIDEFSASILSWARPDHFPATGSPMKSWPMASGYEAFTLAFGYLVFVLVFSIIMKSKTMPAIPHLYGFKFAYNIIQVMLCSYMSIEAGVQAWKAGYTLLPCQKFDHTNPPIGFILYIFYMSKILDFMDTVFIIAEKRWTQLSFLHVYHHFSIFLFYWLNLNVGYDSDVYLTIVLNGLIHTLMYTYYFVSLHMNGTKIWWKPALTMGQMTQFVVMNLQAGYLISTECSYFPQNITKAYLYYIVTLLALFMHFFILDNFYKPKKSSKDGKDGKDAKNTSLKAE